MKDFSVVIVAAGNSNRMNGVSKQFLVLNNVPVILYSMMVFNGIESVNDIVVVSRKQDINMIKYFSVQYELTKVKSIVVGGDTRQQSVYKGLENVSDSTKYIAIHDGARPLVKKEDIINVFGNCIKYGSSVLGVKVKDTIKVCNSNGFVDYTPDRDKLYTIQTPQVFEKEVYYDCVEHAKVNGLDFTDDCQLLEKMFKKVHITEGSYSNIKITTPDDIQLAKNILLQGGL